MRNPMKSSKTVTVQVKVDDINRMLYNETREPLTMVCLGIAEDRIYVICYKNGVETVIFECTTVKHLYKVLDSLISDIMFESRPQATWWLWDDLQDDN